MVFKSIIGATCACLAVVSFNVSAAFLQYRDNVGSAIEYDTGTSNIDYRNVNVTNAYYIEIGGTYYDFSYDGSFGDIGFFVGNKDAAFEAGQVSLSVIGSVSDSHADWQVYYDIDRYFAYGCAAGCFYSGDSSTFYRSNPVSFRLTEGPFEGSFVPIPAAVWLFGSGLLGLIGVARRKASV